MACLPLILCQSTNNAAKDSNTSGEPIGVGNDGVLGLSPSVIVPDPVSSPRPFSRRLERLPRAISSISSAERYVHPESWASEALTLSYEPRIELGVK